MKIAVIGGDGQLGRDVVRAFEANGDDVYGLTHRELEIANIDSVVKALQSALPHVVVNTAAMHHVERCEQDPSAAFAVNALGARNLAEVTGDLGVLLMHISTDYVFDGNKREPYIESDAPLPLNVYGNTKLAGEYFVRTLNPKHFVLRTSALYGKDPCRGKGGLNFVELMIKLARERGKVRVVDSEIVSPTSTAELAQQVVILSRSEAYGLYHATAEESCSWYEFAKQIFEATKTEVKLEVARSDEFPAKVPRPTYSVLENAALKMKGLNIFKSWRESVREYLQIDPVRSLPVPA
ncbi:MAG: dTDP-4-dehydrorhamnose reductase [Acidobacteriota bacterium]